MESFSGPRGLRQLELRDKALFFKTGSSVLDEVTEVYATPQDATIAADFLRSAWRAEGYSPIGGSLLMGAAPPAGGLLLGSSGEPLRREKPLPQQRVSLRDALSKDKKLMAMLDDLHEPRWEGTSLVAATVAANKLTALLKTAAASTTLRRAAVSVEEDGELEAVLRKLKVPLPAAVKELVLAAWEVVELYVQETVDFTPALPAFTTLETLTLQAGHVILNTKPELPELKTLCLHAAGLGAQTVRNVLDAHWPRLETLSLFFGSARNGCTTTPADLAPLLEGRPFPAIQTLRLRGTEQGTEIATAVSASLVLARLRTIDLSYSLVTYDAVDRLAAAMPPGARLVLLNTSLSRDERERLKRYPHVTADNPALGSTPVSSVEHFFLLDASEE